MPSKPLPDPPSPSSGKKRLAEQERLTNAETNDKSMTVIHQQLIASRNHYVELYEQAPVGYLTLDDESHILEVNSAAVELIGKQKSSLLHRRFHQFILPDDGDNFIEHLEECRKTGKKAVIEVSIRKLSGEWLPVQLISVPAESNGQSPPSYRTMIIDIRKRKEAEEDLRKLNETLEQKVAERTVVAEERANQLQALASELTRTEQRERRRLAQILHDNLQQILVTARMQLGMMKNKPLEAEAIENDLQQVDELLCRSIQASRTLTSQLSPPILYDADLCAALEWLSRSMLKEYGMCIEVKSEAVNEPANDDVLAFLFQSVREFLFNCIKHANVDQALITTRNSEDGSQFLVSVEDDGDGFDRERFETGRIEMGCFGLFSIRERVNLLGGGMNIDSAIGRGTRISLYLPLDLPERKAETKEAPFIAVTSEEPDEPNQIWMPFVEKKPQSPPEGSFPLASPATPPPIRVLLADDHKILREGLAGLLRVQPDIEVVGEAANGRLAVDLARQHRPDIIVMDISMPELNGIEATRLIREEMPEIRIIGLSMHEEEDMAKAIRDAGAIAYITKAVASETLSSTIRTCMKRG